jgi:Domain of unknown function (DUF4190)
VSSPWGPPGEPWSSGYNTPAPYGSAPYGPYGYTPGPPTSGLAIAALVCGILGLVTLGVASIAAVVCGHLAWRETSTGERAGHGMTIAGLVLGYLPIVGWVVFWLVVLLSLSLQ